jgi:glycosyltransferase involved in cell wall biosynthesis
VSAVHFIVPEGIDDPERPSGGNVYDRHVSRGLRALGWDVREHHDLARALASMPDGATVLLDGLLASPAPGILVPEARRLRQVVLMHMPLATAQERAVLEAAVGVVATSAWTKRRLAELYGIDRVHVAEPGVEEAELARGSGDGGRLLCVAAVTPHKGHDVLLDALAVAQDLPWRCECVGSLIRDADHAERMVRRARRLNGRVRFTGARIGGELRAAYAAADLLVLPSRAETYGMVVTEALARGVPVIAADVGGVREALGHAEDGTRPGLLVPPDDFVALGEALRSWLDDEVLRARLRRAARQRRGTLRSWSQTTAAVAGALA